MQRLSLFLLLLIFDSVAIGQTNSKEKEEWLPDQNLQSDIEFKILKKEIDVARIERNLQKEVENLVLMGNLLFNNGNFPLAIENMQLAIKISRNAGLAYWLGQSLHKTGTIYYYNKQLDLAKEYFDESLTIFQSLNNAKGLAEAYGKIGQVYEKKSFYDSAFYFQNKALEFGKNSVDSQVVAKIYENLGSIFEDKPQYDSAFLFYNKANDYYLALENDIDRIEVVNNLADIYRKTGKVQLGLHYTSMAMDMAKDLDNKYQLNAAYRDMAKCYELLGRFDSAYYMMELGRTLMQELYATENNRQIALLEVVYESDRKDREIEKLTVSKKANQLLMIASFIAFVLLLALTWQVYRKQKISLQAQKELQKKQDIIFQNEKILMATELKNKELEEAQLKNELEIKDKELSSQLLHIIQKNKVLEDIKSGITEITKDDKRDQKKQLKALLQKINQSFSSDKYWEEFRAVFDQVHTSFFTHLLAKCPDLTQTELKLLSLLKMNLTTQEIIILLGITADSLRVSRYRVKKKLNLGPDESLTHYLQNV